MCVSLISWYRHPSDDPQPSTAIPTNGRDGVGVLSCRHRTTSLVVLYRLWFQHHVHMHLPPSHVAPSSHFAPPSHDAVCCTSFPLLEHCSLGHCTPEQPALPNAWHTFTAAAELGWCF